MRKIEFEALMQKMCQIEREMFDVIGEQKTIRETQEYGLVGKKCLVIIYDDYKTRVYANGKEISDGIKSITFTTGETPTIEYERIIV